MPHTMSWLLSHKPDVPVTSAGGLWFRWSLISYGCRYGELIPGYSSGWVKFTWEISPHIVSRWRYPRLRVQGCFSAVHFFYPIVFSPLGGVRGVFIV